jgi:hypothetical protein
MRLDNDDDDDKPTTSLPPFPSLDDNNTTSPHAKGIDAPHSMQLDDNDNRQCPSPLIISIQQYEDDATSQPAIVVVVPPPPSLPQMSPTQLDDNNDKPATSLSPLTHAIVFVAHPPPCLPTSSPTRLDDDDDDNDEDQQRTSPLLPLLPLPLPRRLRNDLPSHNRRRCPPTPAYNCCLLNSALSRMCFDCLLLLEFSIPLVCLLPVRLV